MRFVFLGRYEKRKGLEELNTAINELSKEKINAEFHFIGPIPDTRKIQSEFPYIFYHGTVMESANIKDILDNSDVLICPSYSEGMPNVILEGMARGLAIIATNVGSISQLVNNENGILLKQTNVFVIKDAIISFVNMDYKQLISKKYNSLLKVNYFTWENIAIKHKELISELIEK